MSLLVLVPGFLCWGFPGLFPLTDFSPWCGVAPFLRPDPFFEFVPFGEAINPGPFPTDSQQDRLVIGTANPTTLLGREPDVCFWGRGIYGFSETAATAEAQSIIASRFRAKDFNVVWFVLFNLFLVAVPK